MTTGPVDFARLQEIADNDFDFERELIQMFLDESEKRIAAISSAKSSGDMKALKAEAHALKGTGGNIGATGVHRIASDLQEAAEQGLPALLDDLVAKLKTELFAVEEALKRRLKSLDEEGSAGGASA